MNCIWQKSYLFFINTVCWKDQKMHLAMWGKVNLLLINLHWFPQAPIDSTCPRRSIAQQFQRDKIQNLTCWSEHIYSASVVELILIMWANSLSDTGCTDCWNQYSKQIQVNKSRNPQQSHVLQSWLRFQDRQIKKVLLDQINLKLVIKSQPKIQGPWQDECQTNGATRMWTSSQNICCWDQTAHRQERNGLRHGRLRRCLFG